MIWHISEGSFVSGGDEKVCAATISGKCCNLLLAERTVLNILTRASGVASEVT